VRTSWLGLLWVGAVVAGCADPHVQPSAYSHQAAATAEVSALVAAAPVLPGARESRRAPLAVLTHPPELPGTDNVVERTRWWTAPGSTDQAIAYLRAHAPGRPDTIGQSSDGSRWLAFRAKDTAAYVQAQLVLEVVADAYGVAVRADGQAVWLPTRPAGGYLPGDVTSVDVTIERGLAAPTLSRTLPAASARRMVSLINGLPVWPPGAYSCPADIGDSDHLVFHAPHGSIAVTASRGGCGTVEIGSRTPALRGGTEVDQLLRSLLGLR
jgi:hypothetical protein